MTVIQQIEQFAATYPKTFALIAAALALLLNQLWLRYKNRVATLSWTANHQQHSTSINHPTVGTIAVTVNGTAARTLFFTKVRVTNTSTRDLTDLEVELELPEGSTILDSEGAVDQGLTTLAHSQRFTEAANAANARWNEQTQDAAMLRARVSRWRAYRLPALNRQSGANFTFFWENTPTVQPVILTSCTHAGVRIVYREPPHPTSVIWGVNAWVAAGVGLLTAVILLVAFAPSWTYFLPLLLGLAASLIGAGLVLLGRAIGNLFS